MSDNENLRIVYKSCGNNIVILMIDPSKNNNLSRKVYDDKYAGYRCRRAYVVSIMNKDDESQTLDSIESDYNSFIEKANTKVKTKLVNPHFIYTVGEWVKVSDYDDFSQKGIHFHKTKEAAWHHNKHNYLSPNFTGIVNSWSDNGELLLRNEYQLGIIRKKIQYKDNSIFQKTEFDENGKFLKQSIYFPDGTQVVTPHCQDETNQNFTLPLQSVQHTPVYGQSSFSSTPEIPVGSCFRAPPIVLPSSELSPMMKDNTFKCPLTQKFFIDPVLAADGVFYEREVIEKWLKENNNTSPITKLKLPHNNVCSSLDFNQKLKEFYQSLPPPPPPPPLKLNGHTGLVSSVAFSPDGSKVVSCSYDRTVRVWISETGVCEKILTGHTGRVKSVAISPDGLKVFSGSDDKTIRIWNLQTGICEKVLEGHTDWVNCIVISVDGTKLVSGSSDSTVIVWDIESGEIEHVFVHEKWVDAVAIFKDGSRVVSASGKTISIWDIEGDICEKEIEMYDPVTSLTIIFNDSIIISGSKDKSIYGYNIKTRESKITLDEHTGQVRTVAYSLYRGILFSGSDDNTIRVWSIHENRCIRVIKESTGGVLSIAISSNGEKLVFGGYNAQLGGEIQILNLIDMKLAP